MNTFIATVAGGILLGVGLWYSLLFFSIIGLVALGYAMYSSGFSLGGK